MSKRWIPGEIITASGLNQTTPFGVVQQPVPNLTVNVASGSVIINGQVVTFSGGNSPSFTVPTTNPRIDLLCLNSSGNLEIVQGTESANPTAPTYPTDKFVICEVYNRPTQTCIKESSDGVNGYIYKDVRGFVGGNIIDIASGVSASDTLQNSNDTERSIYANTSYQKIKETKITGEKIAGFVRVKVDIRSYDSYVPSHYIYARVYLNGNPIGAELSALADSNWHTVSDDVGIIAKPNDLIQIYIRTQDFIGTLYCRNFRIYFTLNKKVIYQIERATLNPDAVIKTTTDGVLPTFVNQDP